MGRDKRVALYIRVSTISIHAPVWGATVAGLDNEIAVVISIHAPVWGATRISVVFHMCKVISIHAPVWGATRGQRLN